MHKLKGLAILIGVASGLTALAVLPTNYTGKPFQDSVYTMVSGAITL